MCKTDLKIARPRIWKKLLRIATMRYRLSWSTTKTIKSVSSHPSHGYLRKYPRIEVLGRRKNWLWGLLQPTTSSCIRPASTKWAAVLRSVTTGFMREVCKIKRNRGPRWLWAYPSINLMSCRRPLTIISCNSLPSPRVSTISILLVLGRVKRMKIGSRKDFRS